MNSELIQLGDDTFVIFPEPILKQTGMQCGDSVDISVNDNGEIVIIKVKSQNENKAE